MRRPASTRRHRASLSTRLCAALAIGALFVAALLGLLGADRNSESRRTAAAEHDLRFVQQFSDRAAPLLERGDLLRLSMLATAARDLHGARVLVLERSGRVVLDTELVLGDRSLALLAHNGAIQRLIERDDGDSPVRETIAPVRFGGEVMGEVRMQTDPRVGSAAFDSGLFFLVLLGGFTLIAVAWLLAQHWAASIKNATSAIAQIATGQPTEEPQPTADRELHELGLALRELERGVHDGLHRVVEPFLDVAMQVVEGLERRGLVPEGRGLRTSRYALLLANRLDLQPLDRRDLDLACRLAEFGRAWIRPSLLQKQSMSADEQQLVRTHPTLAAERLDCLPGLRDVAQIVGCQAERYDGGGPAGLRGERIPIAARILAIAGAFDLWTTCGDPTPLGPDAALRRMAEDRGEAFDPWLFDLFADAVRMEPKDPPVASDEDKAVMILPAGGLPAPKEREDGLDYALGAELDVMLDELPPEDKK